MTVLPPTNNDYRQLTDNPFKIQLYKSISFPNFNLVSDAYMLMVLNRKKNMFIEASGIFKGYNDQQGPTYNGDDCVSTTETNVYLRNSRSTSRRPHSSFTSLSWVSSNLTLFPNVSSRCVACGYVSLQQHTITAKTKRHAVPYSVLHVIRYTIN